MINTFNLRMRGQKCQIMQKIGILKIKGVCYDIRQNNRGQSSSPETVRNVVNMSLWLQYKQKKNRMRAALIIVDPQNDFCEGGPLAVAYSSEIFPVINRLKKLPIFQKVIITKDWHPESHISFATTHKAEPFSQLMIENTLYTLWPTHCIQGSKGAEISPLLQVKNTDIIVNKGTLLNEESYSGFGTEKNPTQLCALLKEADISNVFVVGLAFDYCVAATAYDAQRLGFTVFVVEDGTKAVKKARAEQTKKHFQNAGIKLIGKQMLP